MIADLLRSEICLRNRYYQALEHGEYLRVYGSGNDCSFHNILSLGGETSPNLSGSPYFSGYSGQTNNLTMPASAWARGSLCLSGEDVG